MSGTHWYEHWVEAWGLSGTFPAWLAGAVLVVGILFFVIPVTGWVVSYADRKLAADFQARIGPNRTGPAGFFQPFADFLKLLQKRSEARPASLEDLIWTAVHTMALYSTVAVLPLGSMVLLVDSEMTAFLPFWALLVLGFGSMLLGLSQGTVPGWLGGMRIGAQTLSGAFPALMSLYCAGIHAHGFKWSQLAASQGASPWTWTFLSQPFLFLAGITFVMSGMVMLGVAPLDGGFSEPDLHGGVSARLSGVRLLLFRMGRFYGLFFLAAISVVLFFGAWNLPPLAREWLRESGLVEGLFLAEMAYLLVKCFFLLGVLLWVARVSPKLRVDQVTDFSWRVLGPLSIVGFLGTALWSSSLQGLLP